MSTQDGASPAAPGYTAEELSQLADLLDKDGLYDLVTDLIMDARDKAPRATGDRDSGEVLGEVIVELRRLAAES